VKEAFRTCCGEFTWIMKKQKEEKKRIGNS
jgi:hypothetical protein